MFDVLLRGGTVVDGSGRPGFRSDVAIKDGKIQAVQDLSEAVAEKVIDVKGLVVSPGFIDMHSHSDLSILTHPKAESSISQGITTEIVGSCGWSLAPVKEETKQSVLRGLLSGLVHPEAYEKLDWSWHSFGELMDKMDKAGTGVNVAPLVGQSLLRAHVVGTEKRGAVGGEIDAMKCLLRDALESGAWGMSTGRSYLPGGNAPTEEIIALAQVVAEFDGLYSTHMKNESDELFEAVDEVIRIAELTGVKAEISHHKALGKRNFGKVRRSLEMIENARRKGLRISADCYPYEFSQASSLARYLPPEAMKLLESPDGTAPAAPTMATFERAQRLLRDPGFMAKVKDLPEVQAASKRFGDYYIVKCPSRPEAEGRVLEEYAAEAGKDALSLVFEFLLADGLDVWAASAISMDDVHDVISAAFVMPGTDAFALDRPITPIPAHPRHYGTFPRVVGRFVKEGLFSLETAVMKSTWLPARTVGLSQRGLIEPGYWADLVVFDPDTLMDTATGTEPYARAEGIKHVFVNGVQAMENGVVKAAFAGRVLRKN